MISKAQILREIRRIAEENDGTAPGRAWFEKDTGIRAHMWRGRYWTKWSDALAEAGFAPNAFGGRLDELPALIGLAEEVRRLGRMATTAEIMMWRRTHPFMPTVSWYLRRYGSKDALIARLVAFASEVPEYADIADLVGPLRPASVESDDNEDEDEPLSTDPSGGTFGYVYLLKSGRYYKIGRSNAVGRRERELAIQLPQKVTRVHAISTDDPVGIERYWHMRFAEQRVRPDAEWFELSASDIAAFRRRKFQ